MVKILCAMAVLGAAVMTGDTSAAASGEAFKFDNVRLLVTRFDETLAFYHDALGLTLTWGAPGGNYASFAFPGGGQLALFRRGLMAEAVGASARPATR